MSKASILVVDDEPAVLKVLVTRLQLAGYKVFSATNGEEAIEAFHKESPDLIVLDVMLPKMDGFAVCRRIRAESVVPIIFLTALEAISERVAGLDLGADDYLSKPFSPKELEARIYSILRRTNRTSLKTNRRLLYFDNLTVDTTKKQIIKGKRQIHLTAIEFSIVELLATNAGKKLSRTYIFNNIWGYKPSRYLDIRVVDVHISRLRAKLENDVKNPCLILTARGIGYMFQSL